MAKLIITEGKATEFHNVLVKHGYMKKRGSNSMGTHHQPYEHHSGKHDKIVVQSMSSEHVRALVPGKGSDDFWDYRKLDNHLTDYHKGK